MSSTTFASAYPAQTIVSSGSTPQMAALNSFKDNNATLSKMNNALSGGKQQRKKYRGGQTNQNTIVVPQAPMIYKDQSVPGINGPDGSIAKLASISNQTAANAVYDNKVGGYRKRRTKRFLTWGCYSGGKRKMKKGKKTRKQRKTRK